MTMLHSNPTHYIVATEEIINIDIEIFETDH